MFCQEVFNLRNLFGRFLWGCLFIGIGAIFLLNQTGYIHYGIGNLISMFWPTILIVAGLSNFINNGFKGGNFVGSGVLIIIGIYFLGRNTGYLNIGSFTFFNLLIAAVLIMVGIQIIFKPKSNKNKYKYDEKHDEQINFDFGPTQNEYMPPPEMKSSLDDLFKEKNFYGEQQNQQQNKFNQYEQDQSKKYDHKGYEYKNKSDNNGNEEYKNHYGKKIEKHNFIGDVHLGRDYFQLYPTNVSHFIGDTIIDLTKAQIPYGETKINVSAFIGDVKIFVPNDMDLSIKMQGNAFLGDIDALGEKHGSFLANFQKETLHYGETNKSIKLNVNTFIGDIKVNVVG